MAKDEKKDSSDVQRQRDLAREGRGPEAGWCLDHDRDPEYYRCSDQDERVARGEVSVSFDGKTITNLETGEVERKDDTGRSVTAPSLSAPGAATGADTTTTGTATATRGGAGVTPRG